MSRQILHRVAIVAVLILWISPGASAMAMSLHMALDHHAHSQGDHDVSLAELVRAAMHGHQHDVAHAPDHEHRATGSGTAPVFRSNTRLSVDLVVTALVEEQKERQQCLTPLLRHGPPAPLFAKNCSLLI